MAYDARELDLQAQGQAAPRRRRSRRPGCDPAGGLASRATPVLLETTLGRALFNEALPEDYPFVDVEVDKKQLSAIVNDLAERYPKVQVAATLDALKEAGFHWATRSGVTISIGDVVTPPRKAEILEGYEAKAEKVAGPVREGPDHRRRAPPGAHRDLDPGHQRGRRGDGGELPRRPTRSG